jgi:putative inorganic carbon (hco3(-)) transporter
MTSWQPFLFRAAIYCALGSAVSILFSIAASQSLLALAIVALLLSGAKIRVPSLWIPLGLFLLGTLISLALSDHPVAGLPQVRKFYVFLVLPLVFSTIRDRTLMRRLFLCWSVVGAGSAMWGMVQFLQKMRQAHALGKNFYEYYTGERITGAMSHWMTFGGQEMFVLLMLAAFIFFGPANRLRQLWPWIICALLLVTGLLLGETRSIWLATVAAGLYLVWFWKRWVIILVPLVLALIVFLGPTSVRERFTSFLRPRKEIDSNEFRLVTWRTGLRMIEAHPWFGLGPEEPRIEFDSWVPSDVPRPLPTGSYIHLHNIYLQYAAERGIPTMLLMSWLLIKALVDFARGIRKLPPGRSDDRFLLHGAIAIVVAAMVEGFFEYNLGDSEVLTMFLVTLACGYTALELTSRKEGAVG